MNKRQLDDPSFIARAAAETERLVREHKPTPMTDSQLKAVDAILANSIAGMDSTAVPDWKVTA